MELIANMFAPLSRTRNGLTYLRLAIFSVLYFTAATLGAVLIPAAANIPIIWPASGIALGGLLIVQKQDWAKLLLVIFVTNLTANLVTGNGGLASFWFSLVNCLQCLASAWLLRRYLGNTIHLTRLKEVVGFCGITVVVSSPEPGSVGEVPFDVQPPPASARQSRSRPACGQRGSGWSSIARSRRQGSRCPRRQDTPCASRHQAAHARAIS